MYGSSGLYGQEWENFFFHGRFCSWFGWLQKNKSAKPLWEALELCSSQVPRVGIFWGMAIARIPFLIGLCSWYRAMICDKAGGELYNFAMAFHKNIMGVFHFKSFWLLLVNHMEGVLPTPNLGYRYELIFQLEQHLPILLKRSIRTFGRTFLSHTWLLADDHVRTSLQIDRTLGHLKIMEET